MFAPTISLDDTPTIGEDVVFRELEGEIVILNLEKGEYFGVDDVGTRVWTLFAEGRSLRQVADIMVSEYDVPRETVAADLLRLTGELISHGLIHIDHAGPERAES
jgi:hypothetical protein